MKILYSSWLKPGKSYTDRSSVKMGEISNFLSQKHGFETIFVGDKKSLQMYKNIPFNQVLEFDDRIYKIPERMWSAGKLIALSMMQEPVVHIDFDMFFINPPDRKKLENEIICFHSEEYETYHWIKYYFAFDKENLCPENTKYVEPISHNSAIIGGSNIDFIKECVNGLIDHIILHKKEINNLIEDKIIKENFHAAFGTVLLEQIWLYQIYKNNNKEISFYFDGKDLDTINKQSKLDGAVHFWGSKNGRAEKKTVEELYKLYIKK